MRRPLAPLVLLALLAACRAVDARGGDRVVGVSKQINEFLYAIHAESVLVARDLTSVYPPQITKLPSVGYHRALNAEGIISMRPTMLLTDGNFGPDAVAAQVKKVGIPIVTMKPGATLDDAQRLMADLGRRFHHEKQADSVIGAWKAAMDRALADSASHPAATPPRVLVMHFGQIYNDYLGVKRGSVADQIIRWVGGVNALDSAGGMLRLTPELIAKAAPDVIIATDVGFDRVGSVERFAQLPGVALTPAGKARNIHRLDESYVMYFGPRTPAAIDSIRAWVRPTPAAATANAR